MKIRQKGDVILKDLTPTILTPTISDPNNFQQFRLRSGRTSGQHLGPERQPRRALCLRCPRQPRQQDRRHQQGGNLPVRQRQPADTDHQSQGRSRQLRLRQPGSPDTNIKARQHHPLQLRRRRTLDPDSGKQHKASVRIRPRRPPDRRSAGHPARVQPHRLPVRHAGSSHLQKGQRRR